MGSAAVKPVSEGWSASVPPEYSPKQLSCAPLARIQSALPAASRRVDSSGVNGEGSLVRSFRSGLRVKILRQISSGACCKLFLGEIAATGEVIVLKAYNQSQRGYRERKQELKILRVIESAHEDCEFVITPKLYVRKPFIGIEYCVGVDLTHYLRRGLPDLVELQRFAREIALGLQFLHDCKIIHEDIKPENIGLTADNHVRILDFGLSVQMESTVHESSAAGSEERQGPLVLCRHGTAPYSCPEKLLGKLHGAEVDWWSYGVVMFELSYGMLPWLHNDELEMCDMICTQALTIPPSSAAVPTSSSTNIFVRDLIGSKDPRHRLGFRGGAKEILAHHFFRAEKPRAEEETCAEEPKGLLEGAGADTIR